MTAPSDAALVCVSRSGPIDSRVEAPVPHIGPTSMRKPLSRETSVDGTDPRNAPPRNSCTNDLQLVKKPGSAPWVKSNPLQRPKGGVFQNWKPKTILPTGKTPWPAEPAPSLTPSVPDQRSLMACCQRISTSPVTSPTVRGLLRNQ